MKLTLLILSLLACSTAQAVPYLTANPYLSSEQQPTRFMLTFDGAAPVISQALLCDEAAVTAKTCPAADNSVILRYDIASLSKTKHSVTAKACDDVGCSEASPLFTFSTGILRVPGGFRVKP